MKKQIVLSNADLRSAIANHVASYMDFSLQGDWQLTWRIDTNKEEDCVEAVLTKLEKGE